MSVFTNLEIHFRWVTYIQPDLDLLWISENVLTAYVIRQWKCKLV